MVMSLRYNRPLGVGPDQFARAQRQPLYNRPVGVGPDQFARTLARILTLDEQEEPEEPRRLNLRERLAWERRQRESKLAALGASPGVGLVGVEDAYQQQTQRQWQQEQDQQLRAQQMAALGASPGAEFVGADRAVRRQQQQAEDARRQFGYYAQAMSQDPVRQPLEEARRLKALQIAAPANLLRGISLDAPQRELGEMSAISNQIRGVLAEQQGSEQTVQTPSGPKRAGAPPQPLAMRQYLDDLQGADEATKYRVAQTLKNDPVLRAELISAAAMNPADNVLKDYFDPATGILDAVGVVGSALMEPVVQVSTGSKFLDTLLDVALSPGTWLLAGMAPGLSIPGRLLTRPLLRRTAAFGVETGIGASAIAAGEATDSLPVGLGVALALGAIVVSPGRFLSALQRARSVGGRAARTTARTAARGVPATVRRAGLDAPGSPASAYMTGSRYSPTHQVLLEAAASLRGAPAAAGPAATRMTAAGGRLAEAGGAAVRGAPTAARGAPMAIRRAIPTPGEVAGSAERLALGGREAIEATAESVARRGRAYTAAAEQADPQYARYMYGRPGQLAALGESAISRIPMIRRTGTALDEGISARPGRKLFGQEAAVAAREATEAAAAARRSAVVAGEEAAVGAARAGIVRDAAERIPPPREALPDEYFYDPEGILQVLNEAEGPLKRLGELLHQVDVPGMRKAIREAVVEGRRVSAGRAEPFWRGGSPEEFLQGKARLEGEIVTDDLLRLRTRMGQEIGPLRTHFTTDEVKAIYATTTLLGRGWDVFHAQEALMGLVFDGVLPTGSRLRALELAVGPGIIKPLLQTRRSLGERGFDVFMDLIGLPRSLLASTDLSALLRQGLPFTARDYYRGHFKPMLKAATNEKYARIADLQLRQAPIEFSDNARQGFAQLEWLDMPGVTAGGRSQRAEEFTSNLADRLPLVKQSNRAYTYSSNAFRAGWYKNAATLLDKTPGATLKDYMDAANWANVVSGRGNLPQSIRSSAMGVWLNNFFFSPRFLASRIQILTAPFLPKTTPLGLVPGVKTALGPQALGRLPFVSAPSQASRVLRKEIARDLVNTYGMIASGLGLAKLGGFDVNLNPTHADFGKATFGDLKLDFSAGFGSVIRLVAQIGAAQRIKAGTGERTTKGLSAKELYSSTVELEGVLARFFRGKLAPPFAFFVDVHTGRTIIGDEVTAEEMLKGNLMPITGQDIWTAFEEQGFFTALAIAPAALTGIGVGNYQRISEAQASAVAEVTDGRLDFTEAMWNTELRKRVNASPGVKALLDEIEPVRGPMEQRLTNYFLDREDAQRNIEAEFLPQIQDPSNQRPARRREIASDIKAANFRAGQGLLANEELRTALEEGNTREGLEDYWASQYYSVPLETYSTTGDAKWSQQREARESILEQGVEAISNNPAAMRRLAVLFGIKDDEVTDDTIIEYLSGNGVNSFGSKEWFDPTVQELMRVVDEDTRSISDHGFFDLPDQAWEQTCEASNPEIQDACKKFDNFNEYVHNYDADTYRVAEWAGEPWDLDSKITGTDVEEEYTENLINIRWGWLLDNLKNGSPQLAAAYEFVNWSEDRGEEDAIRAYEAEHGTRSRPRTGVEP